MEGLLFSTTNAVTTNPHLVNNRGVLFLLLSFPELQPHEFDG